MIWKNYFINKNSTTMLTSQTIYSSNSSKDSRFTSFDPSNFESTSKPIANNDNDDALDIQKRSEQNLKEYFLEKGSLKASGVLYHSFPEVMNNTCSNKIKIVRSTNQIMESLWNPVEDVHVHYADGEIYIGKIKEGKRHGIGKMYFSCFEIYEGEWKEDQMHGRGEYVWLTKSIFKGPFKDGKRDGKGGFYQHFDNTFYLGDFKDDLFDGVGKAKTNDGFYEGQWKEGFRDGHGKMTFESHPKFLSYEGVWCKDKMVKRGKFVFKNGDIFEGDGIQNGTGEYIWSKHQMSYSGSWKNGCRDGEGQMECSKDGIYQGTWKNDRMEGNGMIQVNTAGSLEFTFGSFSDVEWQDPEKCEFRGTFTTRAGGYYKGDWLQFRKHGKGESSDSDGITIKGNFIANYPSGEVMVQFPHAIELKKMKVGLDLNPRDPFQLCLQLSNGKGKANGSKKYHGKLENGATYYGEWDDNLHLPQGKGGMIYSDQSIYKGQFEKGKRHGKGEQTEADRSKKYSGIWKNDMKDGEFIVEHSSGLFEQRLYKNDQDLYHLSEEESKGSDHVVNLSGNSQSIDEVIVSNIKIQLVNALPRTNP